MRIDSMSSINTQYRMNKLKKISTPYQTSYSDSVEISQVGKDYQLAKKAVGAAPDIREDKIADVKAKYANGFSVSDSDIADKLLESFAI